jgi:hypothetical protein
MPAGSSSRRNRWQGELILLKTPLGCPNIVVLSEPRHSNRSPSIAGSNFHSDSYLFGNQGDSGWREMADTCH